MIDFADFEYKMTHSIEEQLIDEIKIIVKILEKDAKSKASYGKETIKKETYIQHCDRALRAFEVMKHMRSECQV